MGNFEFIFHTEPDDKVYEWISDDSIDYDFWCFLDIKIDGVPFFDNFSSKFYVKEESDEDGFRECWIRKYGISVPVFPIIESILAAPSKLKEENEAEIEDILGQTSMKIIVSRSDRKDMILIAAKLDHSFDGENYWYDGEKVVYQREMPSSSYNHLKLEDFQKGCITSVESYLDNLMYKYPQLKELPYFNRILRMLMKSKSDT